MKLYKMLKLIFVEKKVEIFIVVQAMDFRLDEWEISDIIILLRFL